MLHISFPDDTLDGIEFIKELLYNTLHTLHTNNKLEVQKLGSIWKVLGEIVNYDK